MSAARSELLQGTPVPQRGPAVLLTASTSQREIYGDAAPLVEAAKWEHRETTQAARRCLQVRPSQAGTRAALNTARSAHDAAGGAAWRVAAGGRLRAGAGAHRPCDAASSVQVAHETAAVGQATLDSLFVQGEQLEAAAHGVEQVRLAWAWAAQLACRHCGGNR